MALGSVEFHPSRSAREVAHLTCPPEYSAAQVSAQRTGANLGHRAGPPSLFTGIWNNSGDLSPRHESRGGSQTREISSEV